MSLKKTAISTKIFFWIKQIPIGKVATYGQIAQFAQCTPRRVGTALSKMPKGEKIPWQRVINSQGKISLSGKQYLQQKKKLHSEGILFDARDRVSLQYFQWEGPDIE